MKYKHVKNNLRVRFMSIVVNRKLKRRLTGSHKNSTPSLSSKISYISLKVTNEYFLSLAKFQRFSIFERSILIALSSRCNVFKIHIVFPTVLIVATTLTFYNIAQIHKRVIGNNSLWNLDSIRMVPSSKFIKDHEIHWLKDGLRFEPLNAGKET